MLEEAFVVLERAVAKGEIVWYGLATWTGLLSEKAAAEHIELEELLQVPTY